PSMRATSAIVPVTIEEKNQLTAAFNEVKANWQPNDQNSIVSQEILAFFKPMIEHFNNAYNSDIAGAEHFKGQLTNTDCSANLPAPTDFIGTLIKGRPSPPRR